jgi:citrate/tricarballylate utilization protein
MTICNACRYCEGYCAVFPAMERRKTFTGADLDYLANLCHNCAECYYACQYAPPHEFAVNVPKVLAEVRLQSYRKYGMPQWLGGIFSAAIILMLAYAPFAGHPVQRSFYDVVSHRLMVWGFGLAGILVVMAWITGLAHFWKSTGGNLAEFLAPRAWISAFGDVLRLRYLSSAGAGCTYPNQHHSQSRRWFHHFTFYGFLLCFASTCVAAFYDNFLGWKAPYPYLSVPVVLGAAGGIGLIVGSAGLAFLKLRRDRAIVDTSQDRMDLTFIVLLFTTALTGLLLMALRASPSMRTLLLVHLAVILLLFVNLMSGKFVHGIYRTAALIRYALERTGAHSGR